VIGEAKTSKNNVAQLLTEAERLFEAIEAGERDGDIRRAVNGLVLSLASDVQPLVVGALWRESRCYLPVVCFETGLDPSSERERLTTLATAGADCRLIVIQHSDHDAFFEDVAHAMRAAVEAIAI
jgi:hypothetical protein